MPKLLVDPGPQGQAVAARSLRPGHMARPATPLASWGTPPAWQAYGVGFRSRTARAEAVRRTEGSSSATRGELLKASTRHSQITVAGPWSSGPSIEPGKARKKWPSVA